uniref:Copia protein n=1 Tax=Cajanus cajan TaxID=3821 RepID=A0A151R8B0_CAJCA|nr:Copia protein [Cajanus cajan]
MCETVTRKRIFFPTSSDLKLTAFSDSNWASCLDARKLVTRFSIFLSSALIVSKTLSKAKYRALANSICEIQWLIYLLQDLHILVPKPICLHSNNRPTIQIAQNPIFHEHTKHIKIHCHLVQNKIQEGIVHLLSIYSLNQLADIYTYENIITRSLSFHLVQVEHG